MPGNAMAEPAAAAQTTRAQEDTAARSVHPLSRHHAERREVRENAHTAAVMAPGPGGGDGSDLRKRLSCVPGDLGFFRADCAA